MTQCQEVLILDETFVFKVQCVRHYSNHISSRAEICEKPVKGIAAHTLLEEKVAETPHTITLRTELACQADERLLRKEHLYFDDYVFSSMNNAAPKHITAIM